MAKTILRNQQYRSVQNIRVFFFFIIIYLFLVAAANVIPSQTFDISLIVFTPTMDSFFFIFCSVSS